MLRIAIIIGSTRPGRNGEVMAKWVYGIAQKRNDAEFELVDIKDFNLPLLDEPVSPIINVTPLLEKNFAKSTAHPFTQK